MNDTTRQQYRKAFPKAHRALVDGNHGILEFLLFSEHLLFARTLFHVKL